MPNFKSMYLNAKNGKSIHRFVAIKDDPNVRLEKETPFTQSLLNAYRDTKGLEPIISGSGILSKAIDQLRFLLAAELGKIKAQEK